MHHQDQDSARRQRQPVVSRAMIGRATGVDWVQTCVLKAACDVARRGPQTVVVEVKPQLRRLVSGAA